MARVAVLGGGFGGIAAAVALRGALGADDEVVLVDRRDEFVMGLRKTWHLLGMSPLAYGTRHLAQLEERGIRFVQGEVTGLDPASRTAIVGDERLETDALVLALGASHDMTGVPGLAEHGFNVWSRESLDHGHQAIEGFRAGRALIGIFGMPHSCPPAPYELALLLADRLEERGIDAEVTVFTPAPISLPLLGAAGCAPLDARLAERGIEFLPDHAATSVDPGIVRCANGAEIPFDLLLAVPHHRVPRILVDAGLAGADGWVRVDPATLETGHPGVWAIGDCTAIPLSNGMALPKAGLFAQLEGEVVASRIAAHLRGERSDAAFSGSGACFLEMGGGEASMVSGDFFAHPPRTELTAPSHAQREEKERFEAERLAAWFGG